MSGTENSLVSTHFGPKCACPKRSRSWSQCDADPRAEMRGWCSTTTTTASNICNLLNSEIERIVDFRIDGITVTRRKKEPAVHTHTDLAKQFADGKSLLLCKDYPRSQTSIILDKKTRNLPILMTAVMSGIASCRAVCAAAFVGILSQDASLELHRYERRLKYSRASNGSFRNRTVRRVHVMPLATPIRRIGRAKRQWVGPDGDSSGIPLVHAERGVKLSDRFSRPLNNQQPANSVLSKIKSDLYYTAHFGAGKERCHGEMARLE